MQQGSDSRISQIERLQEVRGGRRLITYITSTRPNGSGMMANDAIRVLYEHVRALGVSKDNGDKLDLFLHTDGGESTVPWRLMSLLHEYAEEVSLLVPHHAYSAGTLTALGADEVVMHPMGILGPTDTSLYGPYNPRTKEGRPLPIEVEDVGSYIEWVKNDVGIRHEDELVQALEFLAKEVHPLALGNVKRSVS